MGSFVLLCFSLLQDLERVFGRRRQPAVEATGGQGGAGLGREPDRKGQEALELNWADCILLSGHSGVWDSDWWPPLHSAGAGLSLAGDHGGLPRH